MDNESEIVRLLTQIRDNQTKQMEVQKVYQTWAEEKMISHQRRAVIIGIVIGVGAALLLLANQMYFPDTLSAPTTILEAVDGRSLSRSSSSRASVDRSVAACC
jgi:hypothetical protein